MRRFSRLRAPAPAGLVPSIPPSGALRAPAAATRSSASTLSPPNSTALHSNRQPRRCLSTSPLHYAKTQAEPEAVKPPTPVVEQPAEPSYEDDELTLRPPIDTPLVYPRDIIDAEPASAVTDPTYTPAEMATDLAEVGGLGGWWDNPAHWGNEGGAAAYVQSTVSRFGPVEKITDPAVLEVLAKRAIVEALTVSWFGGGKPRERVEAMFARVGAADYLEEIAGVELVAKEDGEVAFKNLEDGKRVWRILRSLLPTPEPRGQKKAKVAKTEEKLAEGEIAKAPEPQQAPESQEAATPEPEIIEAAEAAPVVGIPPEVAQGLVGSWDKTWKQAELKDPVVKFRALKRIQQLTGHRLGDGKLLAVPTLDNLIKQLVAPARRPLLTQLLEKNESFKGLPNVRVFPRRVTPIDKEQMVGRWKIIVKELKQRELPITGTGDYSGSVERKWLEGKAALVYYLGSIDYGRHRMTDILQKFTALVGGGISISADDRTTKLSELLPELQRENLEVLAAVVEKLADAARDASWRNPLGDSGLLDHILSTVTVKERPQHHLNKQALRLIGNACADSDENRARVVKSGALPNFVVEIIRDPQEDALLPFALAAALNICVDYNAEPKLADPNTPAVLLSLAAGDNYDADLDTFLEICAPALAYLTFQDFQPIFVKNGHLELLQLGFSQLYTRFDPEDAADPDTAKQLKQTLTEWLNTHAQPHLQTAACFSLGNLSRSDESSIGLLQHVQTPLLDIVTRAIPPLSSSQVTEPKPSAPPLQLTHAALSFLKNLTIAPANKPILGAALLDPINPLLPRLWTSTRTQPQLQFTAVSLARLLLVNCPSNVRLICTPNSSSSSSSDSTDSSRSNLALLTDTAFSADEDPIKIEATRAVSLVCRALHSSPSAAGDGGVGNELLDPSWSWTEDQPDETKEQTALARFHKSHARSVLLSSLRLLLTSTKFPTLRSETIFVLALMAKSEEGDGARTVLGVLQPSSQGEVEKAGAGWIALSEVITGSAETEETVALARAVSASTSASTSRIVEIDENDKEVATGKGDNNENGASEGGVTVEKLSLEAQQVDLQPPQLQQKQPHSPAKLAGMDRENGMVLVAELLRRFPEELAGLRTSLEAVLNKGAELVVQNRGGQ
ncbi:armadillo-type protein [Chaetomium sp. MPI-SDFR-AT-0129]|nr:armadillo-type protein [Chaetomium sp. MPI-SDFR-AT-0129]